MIPERLYFANAYLAQFTARVVERRTVEGRHQVVLDQSAFYPEGGGQPADHGTLNGVAVLDVQAENGLVWHTLAGPLDDDGVEGVIDWPRRFDHMQQHHGQHLLSAAFEHLHGLRTVAFHLGAAVVTIDLDTPTLDIAQATAAADCANQVIWEDRPIHARFVSPEELAQMPLRKPPVVDGPVRVVSVPDFDYSACGGTHPRSTGGVGLIHIRRWERRGTTVRLEFLCGGRAASDYRARDGMLQTLAGAFSVAAEDVPDAVRRVREAEADGRRALAQAQGQLLDHEARALAAAATVINGVPVVVRVFAGRDANDVRTLAKALAEAGCLALLAATSERSQLIFARAEGLAVDCRALLNAALAASGGRGGGQQGMAQGGLPAGASAEAALAAAQGALH